MYNSKDKISFILIFSSYLIASVYLFIFGTLHQTNISIYIVFTYVLTFSISYLIFSTHQKKIQRITLHIEDLQEKINLVNEDVKKEAKINEAFRYKINRYQTLEDITKKLAGSLYLEDVTNILVDAICNLIGKRAGNCFLYINDPKSADLQLFKSKISQEDKNINAKEGDIFDKWVVRHTSPLLVEDTGKDFRFNLDSILQQKSRPVGSLVAAPMFRENKFIGILRVENKDQACYTQEDLRLLSILADVGAISIENAFIYNNTQELAIKDDLTGLYLKRYILDRFKKESLNAETFHGQISVIMLDIDHFKNYNDKFGHMAGDIVLKNIALWLQETLGDYGGIIGRFGGEEFIVILPGMAKLIAVTLAENLREKIANQRIVLRRKETRVTISLGLASFPSDKVKCEELIKLADEALYKAKNSGRNRLCYF